MNTDEILKNMKVLYVEDDEEAREELTDVLKRRVGKVIVGENGKRGLELYNDFLPDIIIADFYMPEMDGIEMIRRIRRQGADPAAIVISAVSEVNIILSAIDVGIDKYILKPVNVQELLDAMGEQAKVIYGRKKKSTAALPENRKKIEDEIKREFAAMLKNMTGKGPRNVSVFMSNGAIEIVASEVMTIFEKNLLDNFRNVAIIRHVREIFFSVKAEEICSMILRISGHKVMLSEISVNVENDKNKLIFTINQKG
ncbi:response regulator [Mogibacterium sp. NSJ-24]|jgi:YesN/AraC family two-component response regulator|uniref:Stage 0 sporulation protein A homolog n=1 Tax=Lentihominibacter hominis TaxID=2763645 RepID=A0A926E857_9FIRM|nr:response regulator [Lentihominibacter hominis]MBC8568135.1 response regulator [Lentihominibacter hominis]